MKPEFETTLEPLNKELHGEWLGFRVGTCKGLWRSTPWSYEILAIGNTVKGNGHFQATMNYFETSAFRDDKVVIIREVFNFRLAWNLRKHGYKLVSLWNMAWVKYGDNTLLSTTNNR